MSNSEQSLSYFEQKSKGVFKKLKVKIKHRIGWLGIPQLIPYRGYASAAMQRAFVAGALLEDKSLEKPDEKNSIRQNILSMFKRYSGDHIPQAKLGVEFMHKKEELLTNESGLFKTSLPFEISDVENSSSWIEYRASLIDRLTPEKENYSAIGEILVPGKDVNYGVISDIDDTIMVSHSTQTLRKLRLLLTRNSRTRKPFPGVEAFYRELHKGSKGTSTNPFFYISSSEWALYDLIDDFCSFNRFPKGVYLLRELQPGITNLLKQGGGNHEHKFEKIKHVFSVFPDLSFVLIGDNGQHDPEIYARIAQLFPQRIKAIYIRTVKKHKDKRMLQIISDMDKLNVQIIFTPDTINAAQHAQSNNLIDKKAVENILKNSLH